MKNINELINLLYSLYNRKKSPTFNIGITGYIAIGKTYFSKILKKIFLEKYNLKVNIINTDNFLYTNEEIKKKIIKGYPNSFRINLIIDFFKNKIFDQICIYDHNISDISNQIMNYNQDLDINIIEGINILNNSIILNQLNYIIYLDTNLENTINWFSKRHDTNIKKNSNLFDKIVDINLNYVELLKNKSNCVINLDKEHNIKKIIILKNNS